MLGRKELALTIIFTAMFSFVVIILGLPFSRNPWLELGTGWALLLATFFFLLCAVIVTVSRLLLFTMGSRRGLSVLGYILWSLGEILTVSLLYTVFTVKGQEAGVVDMSDRSTFMIFIGTMVFIMGCIGIPYAVSWLFLSLSNSVDTLRLSNYRQVVSDQPEKAYEDRRITLFDNSGVLKFSISSENLYFIESDDNYIKVWYSDSAGQIRQYMLRCRLKTVEDSFADSDLVRCHRKYIVNITKVKILKAEKEGYKISLDSENLGTIPISKTYEQNVLSRFNSK